MSATTSQNPCECPVCHIVLTRKGDIPRHMKTHATDKDQLTHKCSWPGCTFESLQRTNVKTHLRTHSQDKNQACPDCEFKTCDPGSLTRHRKRIHGYIPKPRKARAVKVRNDDDVSADGGRQGLQKHAGSSRHHPYERVSTINPNYSAAPPPTPSPSTSSSSHESPSSSVSAYPVLIPQPCLPAELDGLLTYPNSTLCKREDLSPSLLDTRSAGIPVYWESENLKRLIRGPWPKPLYPATETSSVLQNEGAANGLLLGDFNLSTMPKVSSVTSAEMHMQSSQAETAIVSDTYTSSNFNSRWEDNVNSKGFPQFEASKSQPSFGYTENCTIAPVVHSEQGFAIESLGLTKEDYECIFGQSFGSGFNDSLASTGSPVWSESSPCTSPGSSSPVPYPSCQENGQLPFDAFRL